MGIESYVNRIGGNSNVAEERFESLNIVNCNGVEAIQEIPKLKLDNIGEDYRLTLHDKKLTH